MTISKKIHIPMITALVIGLVVIFFVSLQGINKITEDVYEKEKKLLLDYYSQKFQAKSDVAISNVINLSKNVSIVSALQNNDREIALNGLKTVVKDFKENTKFHNIKIHIHDSKVHSFLRLWKPKKNGDDLSGFRQTIVEVKRTKKPLVAIEIGRAGLILRGLSPIIEKGQYLGSVEFMQGLNSIIRDGRKKGIEIFIVMDNRYLNIASKLQKAPKLNDQFVLASKQSDLNAGFFEEMKNVDISMSGTSDSYYYTSQPIKDFKGNIVGYAIVAKELEQVKQVIGNAKSALLNQALIMVALDIVIIILLLVTINRAVVNPIKQLKLIAQDISEGDGDLNKRLQIDSQDEIAEVAVYFNKFIEKVHSIVSDVQSGTQETLKNIQTLQNFSQQIVTDSNTSNERLLSSSDEVHQVNNFSNQAVSNTRENLAQTQDANQLVGQAKKSMDHLKRKIRTNVDTENELNHKLGVLATDIEKINGILDVIKAVAEQTNLLALNAAIEAARAGEQGRGFAVVADEVRNLSVRTQESLDEVNSTVSRVTSQIHGINQEMQATVDELSDLIDTTNQVSEQITRNSEILDESTASFNDNMDNMNVVVSKIENINESIRSCSELSLNSAQSIQKMLTLFEQTSGQFESLNQSINRFKV